MNRRYREIKPAAEVHRRYQSAGALSLYRRRAIRHACQSKMRGKGALFSRKTQPGESVIDISLESVEFIQIPGKSHPDHLDAIGIGENSQAVDAQAERAASVRSSFDALSDIPDLVSIDITEELESQVYISRFNPADGYSAFYLDLILDTGYFRFDSFR